jgi:putative ABC transport system permease protein
MVQVAVGSIRARLAAFSGAILAIVFAASFIVACGVLIESAARADIGGSRRFTAASAVVRTSAVLTVPPGAPEVPDYSAPEHPPVPAALVAQVRALPGVQHVVGDLSFSAQVVDRAGNPLRNTSGGPSVGHGWSSAVLTPFLLQAGQEPVAPYELVLDADLAQRGGYRVGDRIAVITPAGTQTFILSGIAAPPGRIGLEEQSALFFSDTTARALAPFPGGFARVALLADPAFGWGDVERQLEAVLVGVPYEVLTGDEKRHAELIPNQIPPSATIDFLGTASGLTGFVTIFIVANTFSLSVQQRSREIGLLRAVAATPRQIRWMIASEAAAIAVAGSLVGALLGVVLAWPLRWILIQAGVTPPALPVVYGPIPMLVAFGASLFIAELAVFLAARRGAHIQPSQALREATIERRGTGVLRVTMGLLLAAGALTGFYVVMQVGGEAGAALSVLIVMLLCVAAALLGPLLVWPVGWIIGGVLTRASGATGLLARANVLANRRRSASVVIPLMLTACFATLFLFIGSVQEYGVASHTRSRVVSDYVIISSAAAGLPPSAAPAVQGLPEVAAASGTVQATVVMNITPLGSDYSDLTDVQARGVDSESLASVLDLGVRDGTLAGLHGDRIAISDLIARGRSLEVGDDVALWLPDGTLFHPRVAAIYTYSMGFADVLLPREVLSQHTAEQMDAEIFVASAAGVGPDQFRSAISGLRREIPTLEAIDRATYTAILNEEIRANTRVTFLLAGLAATYTAIAIVNTLMMSVSERTREFAQLRMIGSTHGQVVTMVVWETVIVVVLGVGLGVGISLLANIGFSAGLFGYRLLVIPWFGFLTILGAIITLGFAASAIPTWLAMRSLPQVAIGARE